MKSNKNKVIQFFPNETDKNNKFCKSGGNSRETSENLLFKQTIELKVGCIHSETTVLKSMLEVSTEH